MGNAELQAHPSPRDSESLGGRPGNLSPGASLSLSTSGRSSAPGHSVDILSNTSDVTDTLEINTLLNYLKMTDLVKSQMLSFSPALLHFGIIAHHLKDD